MALPIWIAFFIFGFAYSQEFSSTDSIIEIPEENDVWVLSDSNFEDALNAQPNLLVEFYAPWCGHCKNLAPHYAKAASRLKDSIPPIRIAKVDATINKNLAEKYGVTGYPTLKYFENKLPTDYDGGRTEDTIVSWVLKKSGITYIVINDYFHLQRKLDKAKVAVVLFAKLDSPELKHFDYVTKYVDGIDFILSTDPVALARFDVKEPSLILFKNFDEKKNIFEGKFKHAEIAKFIEKNRKPLVNEFNDEDWRKSFDEKIPAFILICNKDDYEQYKEALYAVAKKYSKSMMFLYGDISEQKNENLKDFLGIEQSSEPKIVIVEKGEISYKYIRSEIPTEESMKSFIKSWKKKEIEPTYKSQELPAKSIVKNVRVLVGKNFDEVVLDKTKDVLVYFYSPYCSHCKDFEPIYQDLAKKLSNVPSLVLAKIDYTQNEAKDQIIRSFPTIKFYPGKKKKGIEYESSRTLESLLQFIKEKASFKFDEPNSDL